MSESRTVRVLGPAPYDVVVGRGLLDPTGPMTAMLGDDVRRVAVVRAPWADPALVRAALPDVVEILDLPVPEGEAAKTAAIAADCWEALGRAGFTRSDAVVTVGGGATTDLGGFVAATWLRGVRVVHVPTSLLGMVDAAVGGKTGIDTGAGKNLVGSFHEPAGVLCDLDLLTTLPDAELVSGLGEVVKCGFVGDPEILGLIEADPAAARDPRSAVLPGLVERSVAFKAAVVSEDLKESGRREVLNYGHTLGHAIEQRSGYRVRHGEAVSLGMVYVAELARRAGRLDADTAARHADALASVGLPTRWHDAPFDDLLATMRVDKKSRGATLRFVVLDALAQPRILAGPDDAVLRDCYEVLA